MAFTRGPPFSLRGAWPGPFRLKQRFLGGQLQWGRDVSIPEMASDRAYVRRGKRASLGPGCFHPRNLGVSLTDTHNSPASMGPGFFHPRNPDIPCIRGDIVTVLQWGRDVSIPEISRSK